MGLLRILLAICVFCTHTRKLGSLHWLDGDLAVESFFVVSGFYMQLVLSTQYTKAALGDRWVSIFYTARYCRLLPMYVLGGLLALLTSLLRPSSRLTQMWADLWALPNTLENLCAKVFLSMTNATMVFQDVIMFLALDNGRVHWTPGLDNAANSLWQGLVVPQAWSLGIELSFYMLAPYLLNRRDSVLIALSLSSVVLKVAAVAVFQLTDPWTYRFFPFELGYFLLGAIAYRKRQALALVLPERWGKYLAYLIAAAIAASYIPMPLATVVYPSLLAAVLPFLFRATSGIRLDRMVGALSYPFYIFHLLAISFAESIGRRWWAGTAYDVTWLAFGIALVLSVIGLALETRYFEPWRSSLSSKQAAYLPVRSA